MANGRHRVLVAEDEELIALCLEEALLDRGLQVQLARDGAEALEMAAASGPFDALLTDVRMPRITGDEVARTMMAAAPELLFVIMSGDTRASIVASCPSRGEVAFLRKPTSPDAVADKVEILL